MFFKTKFTLVSLIILLTAIFIITFGTTEETSAQDSSPIQNLPGNIAYINNDYNIISMNFRENITTPITTDGSSSRRYQWPTWSTDNRLAYFCCDLQFAQDATTQAFISSDGRQPGKEAFQGFGESIIYAYWSPQNCEGDVTCRDLALLVNNVFQGTLSVQLVRDYLNQVPTLSSVGSGSPFYFSWSPTGQAMLVHRNNRNIETYALADETFIPVTISSGAFQTPAWSPVDDRLLVSVSASASDGSNLVVIAPDGEQTTILSNIRGLVSFSWSPDGRYIAYRIINERAFGSLFIIDSATGEVVSRSNANGVIAFFWAPNSERIAYVTTATANGTFSTQANSSQRQTIAYQPQPLIELTWSTINIEDNTNLRHTNFYPTNEMTYLLLYFDQFSPSHSLWSPDSTHITYADVTNIDNLQSSISILDVTQSDSVPLSIANGVFSVWSFQ